MFKPKKYTKSNIGEINIRDFLKLSESFDQSKSSKIHNPSFIKRFGFKRFLSFILICTGIYIFIFNVFVPVFAMHTDEGNSGPIISPVPEESLTLEQTKLSSEFTFNELKSKKNSESSFNSSSTFPEEFYLTVPKLDIKMAKVETNSTDLSPKKALGHYKGSCLPGDGCNTFIYGHSTFIDVRNRYDKGDYSAIFAKLKSLNYGDEFTITYNNKDYRYIVNTSKIDSPKNIDPLKNPFGVGTHKSSATLFTCDPPGSTVNRLMIIGMLVE